MKKLLCIAMISALLLCAPAVAEDRLSIVATDFPCYDFARQVADELADVTLLIHPGVEVHSYEPSPADILAISRADLFVYIGGEGDAWADDILAGFDGEGPAVLRMMDCVTELVEEDGDDEHHHDSDIPEYDEHIWTSPLNAVAMVSALGQKLEELTGYAGTYNDNADSYIEQILAVDDAIREVVDASATRELVFADRFPFAYFVREFGLDYVAAFPSCTADTEPTPQTIMTLIRSVVEGGVPAVYTIELSTQAVARTVAEETGAEILTLHSMQTVTQDEFDAGESYVSIMWKNVEALREGLS